MRIVKWIESASELGNKWKLQWSLHVEERKGIDLRCLDDVQHKFKHTVPLSDVLCNWIGYLNVALWVWNGNVSVVRAVIVRLGSVTDLFWYNSSLHCTENWHETPSTRGIWICKYTFLNSVEISVGNFESPHSCRWFLFMHFAQPEVWYLVTARNEWNEVELVDEYGGVAVQKLCKGNMVVWLCRSCVRGNRGSRDLNPKQQWLSNRASTNVSFWNAFLILLLNTAFSFSAILNARMILAVPPHQVSVLIRQHYFV